MRGLLLGTAVGDALGLPAEGVSRPRARKLFQGRWRHRFLLGRGMLSDDTEHSLFVAQSLLAHPDSPERFTRRLAWCLRLWFLGLPAGIGLATLRSILKLWAGVDPRRSGVWSAGNGAAMRAAPIGAFFAGSREKLDAYLEAATRMTHRDPRALTGVRAVALLAARAICEPARPEFSELRCLLQEAGDDPEWNEILAAMATASQDGLSVADFARSLGLARGVTGYVYHTVPVAAYAWFRHFRSFEDTLSAVLDCGGDSDSTGAIAGALAGAVAGERGIPADWIRDILDWPRSTTLLRTLADRLARSAKDGTPGSPVAYFWPGILPRNLLFLVVVLLHGLRRLAPPYAF